MMWRLVHAVVFPMLLFMVVACGEDAATLGLNADGYFLMEQKAYDEVLALEQELGSTTLDGEAYFQRMTPYGIPMHVRYSFEADHLVSVRYFVGNLPRMKHEIEALKAEIILMLTEQFSGEYVAALDSRRGQLSTRIEFTDQHTWHGAGSEPTRAMLHYNDSGRAGQTNFSLTIYF